ncbi:MAG: AAA family ATPase [Candidatus Lokiarchaeota archaeon]|nr:AAA family ATPase [Candidatus Lokiarchaeota archaeon]
MYISKAIITNFKTVLGSLELDFSDKITLLTGENGSGKSNILDAILFALGAHDERQEGTAIELICTDYDNNKRMANFCEVTLFFENNRPNESITVSRQLRVPKSGNIYSIYKLNGNRSTLSEILELLDKYGIEPDGYNTIKQGEISTRMNESAESRRELIEKISGVSKFDPKISEAEAKINDAKNTLKQVELLIEEGKNRLKDLEKEKDRTLKYRELESKINYQKALKLKNIINQIDLKIDGYNTDITDKNKVLERFRKKLLKHTGKLDDIKKKINEELKTRNKIEQKKMEMTGASRVEIKNLEDIKQRIFVVREKISDLKKKINVYETKSKKDLIKEKKKLKKKYTRSIEEDKENKEMSKDLQAEILKLEDDLPGLEEEYQSLLRARESIENDIEEYEESKDSIDERRRKWAQKTEILRNKKEDMEKRVNEIRTKVNSINNNIKRLKRSKSRINKEQTRIKKFLEDSRKNVRTLLPQIQELEFKLSDLNERRNDWEVGLKKSQPRYSTPVLKIQEARDSNEITGIIGTILELIIDIDRNYALAIEIAGGNKLQSIVSENFESMKKIIEYIEQNDIGQISFYPLNIIEEWKGNKPPEDEKIIGKVIDFIKYDSKYKNVFSNLFKDTLIVKDLQTAKKYHQFRCVTTEGKMIEQNGEVITMGHFDSRFLLINEFYRRKILEINKIISDMESRLDKLRGQINSLTKERQEKDNRRAEIIKEIGKISGREIELNNLKKESEPLLSKLNPQFLQIQDDLKEAITNYENLNSELGLVIEKIQDLSNEKLKIKNEIEETEYGDIENRIKQKKDQLQAVRRKILDSEKQRLKYSSKINQIDNKIEFFDDQIRETQNQINEKDVVKKELLEEKQKLTEKINKQKEKFQEIDFEIQKINEKLNDLQKERSEIIQDKEVITLEMDKIKSEKNEIQTLKSKFEERRRNLKEKIEEFGVTIEKDQKIDVARVNKEIEKLQVEISMLGPVDPSAPEKYVGEKNKINALSKKRELCEKEMVTASEMYRELYRQKKRKFRNTLERLNDNLRFIFNKLHPRGSIKLIPDSDDPLTGGIDIRVNMGSGVVSSTRSLSGGQNSVCTASLIFAIQSLSEKGLWYLLDEIDAHLDNVHSEALGKLLEDLSEENQYIITTPKKSYLRKYAKRIYSLENIDGFTKMVCIKREDYN